MPAFAWTRSSSSNNTPVLDTKNSTTLSAIEITPPSKPRNTSPPGRMDHLASRLAGGKNRAVSRERKVTQSPNLRPTKPTTVAKPANKLDLVVESPPNILYGTTETSTGALFSGRLVMTVDASPEIILETFVMQLLASVTTKHPVSNNCPECLTKSATLNTWTFIREPKPLRSGKHEFPFSYLLPGHLPASTIGQLGVLEYFLVAKATTRHGEEITFRRPLKLSRAVPPGADKNSLRIFPPTNLTAHVTMTPVIHPIGDLTILMRLSGITEKQKDVQTRWRLRKMTWRIEETEKMISPACPKHAHKVGGEGKGVAHEEVRCLGQAELKEGWKTDFEDGTIELEFLARCSGSPQPLCDVASPTGLNATHALVVELVVAEEWAPNKKPTSATPTGAARVLRMQFQITVTERSGMGISWDEEQPPMYEDVPASPPLYNLSSSLKDYDGPPLEDMERLALGEPTRPKPTHLR